MIYVRIWAITSTEGTGITYESAPIICTLFIGRMQIFVIFAKTKQQWGRNSPITST